MDPTSTDPVPATDPAVPFDPSVDQRLRLLARRLVTDAGRADDVVQDVWFAAIGATAVRAPERWLRALTRRFALRSNSEVERRAWRERDAARPEVQRDDAPADLGADVERALEAAWSALRGRQGEVIRLRYGEGLKLREIAERLGIPLGTVKADHAAALRALRRGLDERVGSRRRWALALIPLARRAEPSEVLHGAGAVGVAWSVVGAAAALVGALAWLARAIQPETAQAGHLGSAGAPSALLALAAVAEGGELEAAPAVTTRLDAEPEAAPATPEPVGLALEVVVTAAGSAVGRGSVRLLGRGAREIAAAPLDAAGRAHVTLDPAALAAPRREGGGPVVGVAVRGSAAAVPYVQFFEAHAGARLALDLPGPALEVRGTVVDDAGAPVESATVMFDAATYLIEEVEQGVWRQRRIERADTDAAGRFHAASLSPGGHLVTVVARGYQARDVEFVIDDVGVHELPEPIVLARAVEVRGVVVDAAGGPVPGVQVWFESQDDRLERELATTDASGAFILASGVPGRDLVWARAEAAPGEVALTARREVTLATGASEPIVLELARRPLGRIRLVDGEGRPLPGWMLHLRVPGLDEGKRPFAETVMVDHAGEAVLARDPGLEVRLAVLDLGRERRKAQLPLHSERLTAPWDGVREVIVADPYVPRGTLRGKVLETDGRPFGPELLLYSPPHNHSVLVEVRADGSFRLDGVPPGVYDLMGKRRCGAGFTLHIHHLAPGDTIDFGELRLPPSERAGRPCGAAEAQGDRPQRPRAERSS